MASHLIILNSNNNNNNSNNNKSNIRAIATNNWCLVTDKESQIYPNTPLTVNMNEFCKSLCCDVLINSFRGIIDNKCYV